MSVSSRWPDAGRRGGDASQEASIAISGLEGAPAHYSNHVEVYYNEHEFELVFARVPTKIEPESMAELKNTGILYLEPLVRVIIPPSLAFNLMNVFKDRIDTFEASIRPLLGTP